MNQDSARSSSARSFFFVPGDSAKKISKGLQSAADALVFDLEDAVAADNKPAARSLVAATLMEQADRDARRTLWVRINPLSDPATALADLVAIVSAKPDGIVLPKSESAADIIRLAHYLDALETEAGDDLGRISILPIAVETPAALFGLGSYAGCSARLAGLAWGAEDFAAGLGALASRDQTGAHTAPFAVARSLCLAGARTAGVAAVDTVFADFRNGDGLKIYAEAARRDGFTGMLAIHPDQVEIINAAFTPSEAEIERAHRIVALFAANPGAGVIGLDGKMLDLPHLKQARQTLAITERVKA